MVKLFFGKDTFSIGKEVEKLTAQKEAEVSHLEGESLEVVANTILTSSFFTSKRLLVIKGLITSNSGKEERLIEALKNMPAGTDVIFIEEVEPKKSKLYDHLKKEAEVKNFEDIKNVNLVSFIKKRVEEEGGDIAPLAAERLASFVGPNLWQLTEEVRKLVLYKMGGEEVEPIQTADVDLLVRANFEANIFALLDAVASKNAKRGADLLNSFLESGENGIYIFTMIWRQFRNIAMAKFENTTDANLAKKARIHPFVAKKSNAQARNFSDEEILSIYKRLLWADLKLKSGFTPGEILLRLLA